jgi:hypothetical protein
MKKKKLFVFGITSMFLLTSITALSAVGMKTIQGEKPSAIIKTVGSGTYIFVDDDASEIWYDGPTHFKTIQEAINYVDKEDLEVTYIVVKPGMYHEHIIVYVEVEALSILGSVFSPHKTIIDGDGEGTVVEITGSYNYLWIEGFTIQNGENGITISKNQKPHYYQTIEICYNVIQQNNIGIKIMAGDWQDDSFNRIYNNDFKNNDQHSFDQGINDIGNHMTCWSYYVGNPFTGRNEGNYWDDYTGEDLYHGDDQDIPGSDGIGDTPYNIPGGDNKDYYPLFDEKFKSKSKSADRLFNIQILKKFIDYFPLLTRLLNVQ